MTLVRDGVRPRDIMTRPAFENAIASVATTGGSTNAVLHLMAIAHEAGVALALDDFDRISAKVPLLADLKPSGRFRRDRSARRRRHALVAQRLIAAGVVTGDARTVTGRTLGAEAAKAVETPGQEVVRPLSNPIKSTGGLVILHGNLAPEGAVIKVSGSGRTEHRGPARVFDSEEAAFAAVQHQAIKPGDVVVIRYEGPSGGPGMREMLGVTSALMGAGLGDSVALVTDGRFSGRDPRLHGRPRRARSVPRRSAGGGPRRRSDCHRRGEASPRRRDQRRGAGRAAENVEGSGAAVRDRRDGEIREAGVVGVDGGSHGLVKPELDHEIFRTFGCDLDVEGLARSCGDLSRLQPDVEGQ